MALYCTVPYSADGGWHDMDALVISGIPVFVLFLFVAGYRMDARPCGCVDLFFRSTFDAFSPLFLDLLLIISTTTVM